jgi:mono/diheme cytochrome c family protein
MTGSNVVRSRSVHFRRAARMCGAWVAFARVTAGVVAAPALADEASPAPADMSRGWEFTEHGGAELFGNVCAACHQPDAKGAVGAAAYPPLAGDKKLVSADFMLTVLFTGLRGMPPLGRMMSDEQVADVVNYVRTHFGNSYAGVISAAQVSAARRRTMTTP